MAVGLVAGELGVALHDLDRQVGGEFDDLVGFRVEVDRVDLGHLEKLAQLALEQILAVQDDGVLVADPVAFALGGHEGDNTHDSGP